MSGWLSQIAAKSRYEVDLSADTPPLYDISLAGKSIASTAFVNPSSGGTLTLGVNCSAAETTNGVELVWENTATARTNGHYLAVSYIPATPISIPTADTRIMFEFLNGFIDQESGAYGPRERFRFFNNVSCQIYFVFSSAAGTVSNSHIYRFNAEKRHPDEALAFLRSETDVFSGTGVADWNSIARIDVRMVQWSSRQPKMRARIELRRLVVGGQTSPLVCLSTDDVAGDLYAPAKKLQSAGVNLMHFVTDYEVPGTVASQQLVPGQKLSAAQMRELSAGGDLFAAHNVDHRQWSFNVTNTAVTTNTVTFTCGDGYRGNHDDPGLVPQVGDIIEIYGSQIDLANGEHAITAVTGFGTRTSSGTIAITIAGVETYAASQTNTETARIRLKRYDLLNDLRSIENAIDSLGLNRAVGFAASTYGSNSGADAEHLRKNGFTCIRSTLQAASEYDGTSLIQIDRKYGLIGKYGKLLNLPCTGISTLSTLQTVIDKLVKKGGALILFTHGATDDASELDACLDYLLGLHAAGTITIINPRQLVAEVAARAK